MTSDYDFLSIWCWHWTKCSKKEKKKKKTQVLVVGNNEYNFTCIEFEVSIGHQGKDTLLSAVWGSKDSIWFRNTDFDIFIS